MAEQQKRVILELNENGFRINDSHQFSKISNADVQKIRDLHEDEGLSYDKIAKLFNISKGHIGKICRYEVRAQTPMNYKTIRLIMRIDNDRAN